MAVVLKTPPIGTAMAPNASGIPRSWAGWFNNLYDFLNKSHTILDVQSAVSSSDIQLTTAITSKFVKFRIDLEDVTFSAATSKLKATVSTDNGATYAAGTSYQWGVDSVILTSVTTYNSDGANTDSSMQLVYEDEVNTSTYAMNGSIEFVNPAASAPTMFTWDLSYRLTGGDICRVRGVGHYLSSTPINAIKLFPSSGNFTSGRFVLTGIN